MGGDANVAREERAARALTESASPGYDRIPLPGQELTRSPLSRWARVQNAYVKSPVGQVVMRWFRRRRPGSWIRRRGYTTGVTLTLKTLLAGDRRGLGAFYTSDAEIVVPQWPGLQRRYAGPEGLMDFFEAWIENWDQVALAITEVIDMGAVSVVFGWMHTRGGASGVATRQAYSAIFDYDASKITRAEWFLTWEEGLAAAGLEGEPLPE